MEDKEGANFPWKPPTLWEALGEEVMDGEGETVEVSSLRGEGRVLGIYFSAHWCPPCRGFTPQLVQTYKTLKAAGKQFEIIFASSDRSMADFQSYFAEQPWLAIPQGDKRKETLSSLYGVEGIPTLVLVDAATGETINANGRAAVGADPEGAEFPWPPKPVNDLASPEGINEEATFCLMVDGCTAEVQAEALSVLTPIAAASKAKGDETLFFVAKNAEGAIPQVRQLLKLGDASSTPQMAILDIPDNGGYYVSPTGTVTTESIQSFLSAYTAGALERQQLQH